MSRTSSDRLTLEQYAERKRLDVDFLRRKFGVSEWQGALRFPYFDIGGNETAVRLRFSLGSPDDGLPKFKFRKGDRASLYGLWFLKRYEQAKCDFIILVEGESDTATLTHHGYPVLGIAGASNFREERDAEHLAAFSSIYVVIEPDTGGKTLRTRLSKSALRDRVRFVTLGRYKDASDLHCADPDRFKQRFQEALDGAVPVTVLEEAERQTRTREARRASASLAQEPDILARFLSDLNRSGIVGEDRAARLLYLTLTSRLFAKPVSAIVKAQSSTGKSVLVNTTTRFFPPDAYYAMSASSERALIYSEESLKHRVLVVYEADAVASPFADYVLRTMVSEGHFRYPTVQKIDGKMQGVVIEKEGPTGLIVTTTALHIEEQNETRLLTITADDSAEQTTRVLEAMADEDEREPVDMEPWHALQTWLASQDTSVVIPYGRVLARLVPPLAVRLRRDMNGVRSLIRTHAFLHQASRERDEQGRIIATLEDYAAIRDLVADGIAENVDVAVSEPVRQTVEAVRGLIEEATGGKPPFIAPTLTLTDLTKRLGLDKSTVSRRVAAAQEGGYIINDEWRRGIEAKLRLGTPLPEEASVLPSVERLRQTIAETGATP